MTSAPTRGTVWPIVRLATALLIAAAVIAQFALTVSVTIEFQRDVGTTIVNFFSFFTVLSNIIATVALTVGGVWGLRHGRTQAEPRWLGTLLVCSATYMIVTGIVYNVLLRGIELPQGSTVPWSNEVLHLIAPLLLLADLFVARPRRKPSWLTTWWVLVFPLAWTVYTMLRGELVTNPVTGDPWWYPYPFLDPHLQSGGYTTVLLYAIGIAVVIGAAAVGVIGLARRTAWAPAAATRR